MREIFEKALARLDEVGWARDMPRSAPESPTCILGAVSYAVYGNDERWPTLAEKNHPAYEYLRRELIKLHPELEFRSHETAVFGWNDSERTTEEDVRLLLKRGAEEAE